MDTLQFDVLREGYGLVTPLVRCLAGTRAAFAMGLLATKKDDSELAEALHLEAVLVLDRLPEVRKGMLYYK